MKNDRTGCEKPMETLPGSKTAVKNSKIPKKTKNYRKSGNLDFLYIPILREFVLNYRHPGPGRVWRGGPSRSSCHHFRLSGGSGGSHGSRGSGGVFQKRRICCYLQYFRVREVPKAGLAPDCACGGGVRAAKVKFPAPKRPLRARQPPQRA